MLERIRRRRRRRGPHRVERNAEQLITRTLEGSLSKVFAQVNYARKKQKNLRVLNPSFPLTYGAALRLSDV